MLFMLVPPVLAGLIGLFASNAATDDAYLSRIRLLFILAALLGYLGVAVWTFRKSKGITRWASIVVSLLAVRIVYPLFPYASVIITGWIDGGARTAGSSPAAGVIHYSIGLFTAVLATLVALAGVATVARIKRYFIFGILFAALGVFNFWDDKDRTLSPHPARKGRAASIYGSGYMEVAKDKKRPKRARTMALVSALFDAVMPKEGWIGEVRVELEASFKGNPEMTVTEHLTALDGALLKARSYPSTSARTPPGSAARRRPGRS